jgi:DNA invertase Pin-like site-specific DNA recombinase
VTTLDRLGRDLDVIRYQIARILRKKARFISVAEGEIDRSHAGAFTLSLLHFPAQNG